MRISDWSSYLCSADLRNPFSRDGGIRAVIQAPRRVPGSAEAGEGGRVIGPAAPGPCRVPKHHRHEMRPREGRGETRGKVGRIAEARGRGRVPERSEERRGGEECGSTVGYWGERNP